MDTNRPELQTKDDPIRTLIAGWAEAIRSRDIDRVVAHHDAEVVLYDVPPPQWTGIDDYRRSFEGFLSWLGESGVWELGDLTVVVGDDVAYAYCTVRCRGTGKTETLDVRLTLGLRRQDGQWLITHEHHSVPSA